MEYKVALIADNHFLYTDDGNVYVNGTYTRQYLSRFTSQFHRVTVIARGRKVTEYDDLSKFRESGGDKIEFCFLDEFQGIKGYLLNRTKIRLKIMTCLKQQQAVFVRMPCILTTTALDCAQKLNIPTMIDVGADPETIYEGAGKNLIISFLSKYLKNVCKKACMRANGVSYVTKHILQEKYPCYASIYGDNKDHFTASISNVDISDDFYYSGRNYKQKQGTVKLIHISNNIPSKSSKGHQEAIKVVSLLKKKGLDAPLTFLGDGDGIDELMELASKYGVSNLITFAGRVADRSVYRDFLINNDIFIFPSHSEGLPRVLLEAMATGMVCVSSNVDGIPEILDEKDIFNYWDIDGMAERIYGLNKNASELNAISIRNLSKSYEYSINKIKQIIDCYYQRVKDIIE